MFGIDDMLIGAIAAPIIGGFFGSEGAKDTNQANAAQSKAQMDFQERMSNTSYQRSVKDLESAGLNPMLAYSQGGASAPPGAAAKFENPAASGMSSAAQASGVVSSLMGLEQSQANIDSVKATTNKTIQDTIDGKINTALALADLRRKQAEGVKEEDIARLTAWSLKDAQRLFGEKESANTWRDDVLMRKAQRQLTELDIPRAKADADFQNKLGSAAPGMKWLVDILRGVGQIRGGK